MTVTHCTKKFNGNILASFAASMLRKIYLFGNTVQELRASYLEHLRDAHQQLNYMVLGQLGSGKEH